MINDDLSGKYLTFRRNKTNHLSRAVIDHVPRQYAYIPSFHFSFPDQKLLAKKDSLENTADLTKVSGFLSQQFPGPENLG